MDLKANYCLMARYNAWMNTKTYDLCGHLPDDVRKQDLGAFFRSIHGTLNHILWADHTWLERFTGIRRIAPLKLGVDVFEQFCDLAAHRTTTDRIIIEWTDGLTDTQLQGRMSVRAASTGRQYQGARWQYITHFFNHQTHHRGQVTALLKQAGVDPGLTDLPAMPGVSEIMA